MSDLKVSSVAATAFGELPMLHEAIRPKPPTRNSAHAQSRTDDASAPTLGASRFPAALHIVKHPPVGRITLTTAGLAIEPDVGPPAGTAALPRSSAEARSRAAHGPQLASPKLWAGHERGHHTGVGLCDLATGKARLGPCTSRIVQHWDIE